MSSEDQSVTLRDYFNMKFDEREKALNLAFKAQQEALSLASSALDRELNHLNQLRQEVLKDRAAFVTNDKYESEVKTIVERVSSLERSKAWAAGAIFIIGLLGGGLGSVITKMILAR